MRAKSVSPLAEILSSLHRLRRRRQLPAGLALRRATGMSRGCGIGGAAALYAAAAVSSACKA